MSDLRKWYHTHFNKIPNSRKEKKNITIQCLATLYIISGLIAFKRIDKLKDGIKIYVLSFVCFITVSLYPFLYAELILGDLNKINLPFMEAALFISTIISYIITMTIPIIFIYKMTKEYNKQILD